MPRLEMPMWVFPFLASPHVSALKLHVNHSPTEHSSEKQIDNQSLALARTSTKLIDALFWTSSNHACSQWEDYVESLSFLHFCSEMMNHCTIPTTSHWRPPGHPTNSSRARRGLQPERCLPRNRHQASSCTSNIHC